MSSEHLMPLSIGTYVLTVKTNSVDLWRTHCVKVIPIDNSVKLTHYQNDNWFDVNKQLNCKLNNAFKTSRLQ